MAANFILNLTLARRLSAELALRYLAVRPINFDGKIESVAARPLQAAGADFFIAIRQDSMHADLLHEWNWQGSTQTHTDDYSGFALFVSRDNPDPASSLRCASAIGARLRRMGFVPATHHAKPLSGQTREPADAANAVHYYDNLVVLYRTTLPAVLFEAGVIKNRQEELALLDPRRQALMADAIATGIAACMHVRQAEKAARPISPAAFRASDRLRRLPVRTQPLSPPSPWPAPESR